MSRNTYVIIGGVAGGASAATRLRRTDENAKIILIERDADISYANCGLPYYLGGVIEDRSKLNVATPELMNERFNIDVRTHTEAIHIDAANHRVELRDRTTNRTYAESYTKLLIATGSRAYIPDIPGINSPGIFTAKTLSDTDQAKAYYDKHQPKSIVIIGGGPIGIELADSYSELGIPVKLLEHSPQILNMLDYELAQSLVPHLKSRNIDVRVNTKVAAISRNEGGFKLTLSDGSDLRGEMIFVVAGVRPESMLAQEAGLTTMPSGAINVDEYLATSNPDIYAVGDVIAVTERVSGTLQTLALAGPANKQGRLAADNMAGKQRPYRGALASAILKVGQMTAASTGLNEARARQAGMSYRSATIHTNDHASYYPGAEPLTLKLIFQLDGSIIGAQAIGLNGADKRIDVIATAMRGGLHIDDLAELDLCYAPPYSSAKDPVNMVAFVAQNIIAGTLKPIYAGEVDQIEGDSAWHILDIRSNSEHEAGSIPGSQHIKLENLRRDLHLLDTTKKYLVYCASGLRSYLASRILVQSGFDAYSLIGGLRTYEDYCLVHETARVRSV